MYSTKVGRCLATFPSTVFYAADMMMSTEVIHPDNLPRNPTPYSVSDTTGSPPSASANYVPEGSYQQSWSNTSRPAEKSEEESTLSTHAMIASVQPFTEETRVPTYSAESATQPYPDEPRVPMYPTETAVVSYPPVGFSRQSSTSEYPPFSTTAPPQSQYYSYNDYQQPLLHSNPPEMAHSVSHVQSSQPHHDGMAMSQSQEGYSSVRQDCNSYTPVHVTRSGSIDAPNRNWAFPPHSVSSWSAGQSMEHTKMDHPNMHYQQLPHSSNNSINSSQSDRSSNGSSLSPDSTGTRGSTKLPSWCVVCGDKASGYHYGVTSCEGCKGFFRRSVQRSVEYRCVKGGTCDVKRENRNRCQHCRFKKCVDVGMSRETVRQSKSKSLGKDFQRVGKENMGSRIICLPEREVYIMAMTTMNTVHRLYCAYSEEKFRTIIPTEFYFEKSDDSIQNRLNAWQEYTIAINSEMEQVVKFSQHVPVFAHLACSDKTIILKQSYFRVFVARVFRGIKPDGFLLPDGRFIELKVLCLLYGDSFANHLIRFGNALNKLRLNDTQICFLISAIMSQTMDREFESRGESTEEIKGHSQALNLLRMSLSNREDHEYLYRELCEMIDNDFKQIDREHEISLNFLRQNNGQAIMAQLFREIYHIDRPPLVKVEMDL